ncbi:hypothetical protein JaAD80_28385 [Janthinobacterium sp. AD80]|nr:hypothetical protein JaAD80_28385 [Janthinobacterium sp. AD80]
MPAAPGAPADRKWRPKWHAGAGPVHGGHDGAGARRAHRSRARAQRGNPPDHRHPAAPPPEQSHPDGRGGRGQDGRGGRLCLARGRGQRAGRVGQCARLLAGPGLAAGGRRRARRVRAAPEIGDRRSARGSHARHPLHRRGAPIDRRGRQRRAGRRRQLAETGAGARRIAHHRRHHLGRIQETRGTRPGPGAPFPGGEGGGTDAGGGHRHVARHGRHP